MYRFFAGIVIFAVGIQLIAFPVQANAPGRSYTLYNYTGPAFVEFDPRAIYFYHEHRVTGATPFEFMNATTLANGGDVGISARAWGMTNTGGNDPVIEEIQIPEPSNQSGYLATITGNTVNTFVQFGTPPLVAEIFVEYTFTREENTQNGTQVVPASVNAVDFLYHASNFAEPGGSVCAAPITGLFVFLESGKIVHHGRFPDLADLGIVPDPPVDATFSLSGADVDAWYGAATPLQLTGIGSGNCLQLRYQITSYDDPVTKILVMSSDAFHAINTAGWDLTVARGDSHDLPSMHGPDTDGDGYPDNGDSCPSIQNDILFDQDWDGVGDACDTDVDGDGIANDLDNCASIPNANQADFDSDGIGDLCDDPAPLVNTPKRLIGLPVGVNTCTPLLPQCDQENDNDCDLVINELDNCDLCNPGQADNDNDGIGDVCDPDDDNDGYSDEWDRYEDNVVHADGWDNCPLTFNPDQADTIPPWVRGRDIFGDACEPDDDGDGVPDSMDNCHTVSNADQGNLTQDFQGDACDDDDDNDTIPDLTDNCPIVPNPDQLDTAGEGIGDACANDFDGDGIANGEDPDADGDGFSNEVDNCPLWRNTDQSDYNNDGVGDACDPDLDGDAVTLEFDNCPAVFNPDQADSCPATVQGDACDTDGDGDGVFDTCDNCPAEFNPGQSDTDGDGIGDACDICDGGRGDQDCDGIFIIQDNCPTVYNPGQGDLDADGTGDACDIDMDGDGVLFSDDNCVSVPNPDQADADGDGIGDACEILVPDSDGDGIPDDQDICPNDTSNDADGDGFCPSAGDCDDTDRTISPIAFENLFDCIDNNCNGGIDEGRVGTGNIGDPPVITGLTATRTMIPLFGPGAWGFRIQLDAYDYDGVIEKILWDTDGDGELDLTTPIGLECPKSVSETIHIPYGIPTITAAAFDDGGDGTKRKQTIYSTTGARLIDFDEDGYRPDTDCNDGNSTINPAAAEICDGIDNNCNGLIDEGVTSTFYLDFDNDGFGDPANAVEACSQPAGHVLQQPDNCPSVPNSDQADSNNDGVGDACQVLSCDIDLDGVVDLTDVGLITAARNQPAAGPDDPRDHDNDGVITVLDARQCVLLCTLPGCATP